MMIGVMFMSMSHSSDTQDKKEPKKNISAKPGPFDTAMGPAEIIYDFSEER